MRPQTEFTREDYLLLVTEHKADAWSGFFAVMGIALGLLASEIPAHAYGLLAVAVITIWTPTTIRLCQKRGRR